MEIMGNNSCKKTANDFGHVYGFADKTAYPSIIVFKIISKCTNISYKGYINLLRSNIANLASSLIN